MRYLALTLALATIGCNDAAGPETPESHPVPIPNYDDSKADNYISTNAREYELTGVVHFELPDGFEALTPESQQSALQDLARLRLSTVARNVKSHIDRVVGNLNGGASGEDTQYFTYFRRDYSETESVELAHEGWAALTFRMELVGSTVLMSKVAPDTQGRSRRTFQVAVDGEEDPVVVEIAGSESRDAFPKYDELFADGVYDIAVHFGGDYNTERFDIDTAKWLVETMLEGGWSNPEVTSFEGLKIDSPAFTRPLLINGREIEARVRVFHSDMVESTEEHKLSDAMKESFANADVVLYSGHAGEGAGFILDYQPRHQISATDFATLPLASKYQIYVFDGCRTYRTYVDDLLKNPAKSFANVDIVTTVNTTPFSVGYQTIHQLLYWLTITDQAGNHYPLSWQALLRGLNTEQFDSVHYGVHGIDEDPQLNPHGSEGVACTPCSTEADCGGAGNLCLSYGAGAACGVACTTDTACGDGFRCARLFDDPDLFYIPKQCVRRNYTCQ